MMGALYSAATGMQAQETSINVISNNLSNVDTIGFKKNRVDFQDLLYQTKSVAGAVNAEGSNLPTGIQIGNGVRVIGTPKIFTDGNYMETGNNTDMAINGKGFFEILMPDGSTAYTRNGSFKRDANGQLVNSDGFPLEPAVTIPTDYSNFTIGSDGTVTVTTGNENISQEIGKIELARFINPSGLMNIGKNLMKLTSASGDPQTGTPGENGFGTLSQYSLETSNVTVVDEMVKMISSQRAYEVSSKSIQTADSMLQIANNLKR